ncbi:10495_t:CDS:2 [Funneliformis geosporum]|nr:10495_t:CDS:2 [Funneliformis geosporum]
MNTDRLSSLEKLNTIAIDEFGYLVLALEIHSCFRIALGITFSYSLQDLSCCSILIDIPYLCNKNLRSLSFAYKVYQKFRVPEGLKNVPTLSFVRLALAILSNKGPDNRWEFMRKVLEKEGIGKVINLIIFSTFYYFSKENFLKNNNNNGRFGSMENGLSFIITTDLELTKDFWRRHQYSIAQTFIFNRTNLAIIDETVVKLLKVIEKVDNEIIEVKDLMHRLTLDVLGRAAFGFDFNLR